MANVDAINDLGIRRGLVLTNRLLIVFTEGYDLRLSQTQRLILKLARPGDKDYARRK
jgi:hypothetical protein